MNEIYKAYITYFNGTIGPWEFQAVVEKHGYKGFTGHADGSFTLHS